jgi:hypothetical protein
MAAALAGAVPIAIAQTTGTAVETPPVLLPPEKQAMVKEYVTRTKVPLPKFDDPVTLGMTLPSTVELFGLPQDTMTETPAVTRYRFVVAGDIIAVVEPESLTVIQVIQR